MYTGKTVFAQLMMFMPEFEFQKVANVLAKNARTGNKNQSVWPYRVVMDDGRVTASYGANS